MNTTYHLVDLSDWDNTRIQMFVYIPKSEWFCTDRVSFWKICYQPMPTTGMYTRWETYLPTDVEVVHSLTQSARLSEPVDSVT